jgi:hypothetical protein
MEQLPPTDAERHVAECRESTATIRGSGYPVPRNPLPPLGAEALVRVRSARISVTDGPFAETKELLGGC